MSEYLKVCLSRGQLRGFSLYNRQYDITEVGHFVLKKVPTKEIRAGDVGYLLASIRDVSHILPGDTITTKQQPAADALPGFKEVKPMVFSGLYPSDTDDYDQLRMALDKLKLNDASLQYEPETSRALGFGFRCGFLGLLHMEIIPGKIGDVNLIWPWSRHHPTYVIKFNLRKEISLK